MGNTLSHVNAMAGPIDANNGQFVDDGPKVGNCWMDRRHISGGFHCLFPHSLHKAVDDRQCNI